MGQKLEPASRCGHWHSPLLNPVYILQTGLTGEAGLPPTSFVPSNHLLHGNRWDKSSSFFSKYSVGALKRTEETLLGCITIGCLAPRVYHRQCPKSHMFLLPKDCLATGLMPLAKGTDSIVEAPETLLPMGTNLVNFFLTYISFPMFTIQVKNWHVISASFSSKR